MVIPTLHDLATKELARLATTSVPRGLPTGLGLERVVPGGLPRDKVTVLFSEAGTFKTTVKQALVLATAAAGHNVLDITLEDSGELSAQRYLSLLSGVPYGRIAGGILTDDERTCVRATQLTDTAKRITVADELGGTIPEILNLIRQTKPTLVAVDYIQLLEGRGSQKEALDEFLRKSQLLARSGIAMLLVSQQKQELDTPDQRPTLRAAFGSSAMRMCAKLMIGLYRPWCHSARPSPVGPNAPYHRMINARSDGLRFYEGLLEAWVLKNVLGPAPVAMHWHVVPETGLVTNVDHVMGAYR